MNSCSADDLFQALDGRRISVGSGTWVIEITGIFEQNGSSWIQMTLNGAPSYSLAVKIGAGDTVAEVIEAVRSWLAYPSSSRRIIDFER